MSWIDEFTGMCLMREQENLKIDLDHTLYYIIKWIARRIYLLTLIALAYICLLS